MKNGIYCLFGHPTLAPGSDVMKQQSSALHIISKSGRLQDNPPVIMKTKSIILNALLGVMFVATTSFAAEKSAKAAKATTTAETVSETKKKVIEKGMSGEEIIRLLGKPAKIEPREAPDSSSKVEQWIYRRVLKETTVQVATGSRMVPTYSGFSGGGNSVTEISETIYSPKVVTIYRMTAFLMINGKLEVAKQWNEQEETQA